jgi:hypothetical protein
MARKSSVVLTPAEQKVIVTGLKTELKAAQLVVKELTAAGKVVAKARALEDKEQAKLVKAAEAVLAKAQKALDGATAA